MDWRRKNLERVVDEIKETAYDEGYKAGHERAVKKRGLPTPSHPEILEEAVRVYGKEPQIDMAIEEMSELTKALLKSRRAEAKPEAYECERTTQNIYEG
ncbi:MAG: hypothetical protein IJ567_06445 [Lachnospiraceae bacterium]|nr:hypothetical protein [Lachnospiraceae bacterium]